MTERLYRKGIGETHCDSQCGAVPVGVQKTGRLILCLPALHSRVDAVPSRRRVRGVALLRCVRPTIARSELGELVFRHRARSGTVVYKGIEWGNPLPLIFGKRAQGPTR